MSKKPPARSLALVIADEGDLVEVSFKDTQSVPYWRSSSVSTAPFEMNANPYASRLKGPKTFVPVPCSIVFIRRINKQELGRIIIDSGLSPNEIGYVRSPNICLEFYVPSHETMMYVVGDSFKSIRNKYNNFDFSLRKI